MLGGLKYLIYYMITYNGRKFHRKIKKYQKIVDFGFVD